MSDSISSRVARPSAIAESAMFSSVNGLTSLTSPSWPSGAHPGGLDHVHAHPLAPGGHEQLWQPRSDVGVHPARPSGPRVQLHIAARLVQN